MYRILILFVFFGCESSKITQTAQNYPNSELNDAYYNAYKSFNGKLSSQKYNEIKIMLEQELSATIDASRPILINYFQRGKHCAILRNSNKSIVKQIKNGINISENISTEFNVQNFYISTNDSYLKNYLKDYSNVIYDKGFFKENIFTLDELCRGFFILKPNGEFLKYYGEDYYSVVNKFLTKA